MRTAQAVCRRHKIIAIAAIGVMLVACGSDDDGASPNSRPSESDTSIDTAVDSPGSKPGPPQDGESAGSPCPLLSDVDAAQALGLDSLTMDGKGGNCTWITPDGKKALQVLPADYLRSAKASSPEEQARIYGENTCGLEEPRLIRATGGVGVVCGNHDSNTAVFTSEHAYQVNIGDPIGSEYNAQLAEGDALAKVIAKLQLPDG